MQGRANFQDAQQGFQDLGKDAEAAAKSMRLFAASVVFHRIGAELTAVGDAMAELSKSAFEVHTRWETGMALVRTQTELTNREFARLDDQALNMAKNIARPLEETAEGLYDVFSSIDVNQKQALMLTEQFSKAAVAGGTGIRDTARAAIGALNAMEIPVENVGHVLDVQFRLVEKGIGTYSDFIGVLGDVYPPAAAAGQSLEEVSAALAFATRQGLQASKAGISVARALDMLTRPQYVKSIKEVLGVDVVDKATGDFRALSDVITDMAGQLTHLSKPERKEVLADIFGQGEIRAMRFFNIAIENFEGLNKMVGHFSDKEVKGRMLNAFGIMDDTMGATLQKMRNHFEAIGSVLAKVFWPQLKAVFNLIERLLIAFDKLPAPMKKVLASLFLIATAFAMVGGRILTFTANLMGARALMLLAGQSMASLTKEMLANAALVAKFALKIGLLVAAFVALLYLWDRNKAAAIAFTVVLVSLFAILKAQQIASFVETLKILAMYMGDRLVKGVTAARNAIFGLHLTMSIATTTSAGLSLSLAAARAAALALWAALKPLLLLAAAAIAIVFTIKILWEGIGQALGTSGLEGVMAETQKKLDDWARLQELAVNVDAGTASLESYIKMANDFFGRYGYDALKKYGAETTRFIQEHRGMDASSERLTGMAEAYKELEKTQRGARRAQREFNETIGKVAEFAGMSGDALKEWKTSTADSLDFVSTAFERIGNKAKGSAEKMIEAVRKQIESITNFKDNMRQLEKEGLDPYVAAVLTSMGKAGAIQAQYLRDGTRKDVAEFSKSFLKLVGIQEGLPGFMARIYGKGASAINGMSDSVRTLLGLLDQMPSRVAASIAQLENLPANVSTPRVSGGGRTPQAAPRYGADAVPRASMVIQTNINTVAGVPDLTRGAMEEVRWYEMTRGY